MPCDFTGFSSSRRCWSAVAPASATAAPLTYSALSPDGRDLYVASQTDEEDGALTHFSVGAGGALTYVGCYGLPGRVRAVRVRRVHLAEGRRGQPGRAGRLRARPRPPAVPARRGWPAHVRRQGHQRAARRDVRSLAISPDGRNLYARRAGTRPCSARAAIVALPARRRDGRDRVRGLHRHGLLRRPARVRDAAGGRRVDVRADRAIVVSPDSRHVYTTGWVGGVNEFAGVDGGDALPGRRGRRVDVRATASATGRAGAPSCPTAPTGSTPRGCESLALGRNASCPWDDDRLGLGERHALRAGRRRRACRSPGVQATARRPARSVRGPALRLRRRSSCCRRTSRRSSAAASTRGSTTTARARQRAGSTARPRRTGCWQ